MTIFLVGLASFVVLLGDVLFAQNLRVFGDPGDARFCNYILEHGYLTLARGLDVQRFWNAPFFFPAPQTIAYSENLLGAAPIYWLFRVLGWTREAAFQSWIVACLALDYLAAAAWLRFGLRFTPLAASVGGVVFGLGTIRLAESNHAQLVPQFYSVLAAWGLQIFFAEESKRARARAGLALFFAASVAQIYASIYLGWFLVFGCGVALLWALVLPRTRRALLSALRRDGPVALGLAVLAGLLLVPLLVPYLQEKPAWDATSISEWLPRPRAWLDPGHRSWLYGGLQGLGPWFTVDEGRPRPLFFGLATIATAAAGWWSRRRNPAVAILALTALSFVLLSTAWTPDLQLWKGVASFVPMASGIRAVYRIALAMMLPLCVGVAAFLDGRRRIVALGLGALVVLEQGRSIVAFEPEAREATLSQIEAQVTERSCGSFLYTPETSAALEGIDLHWAALLADLDAMIVQQRTGIPTLNGYSARTPPDWGDDGPRVIRSEADVRRLELWLERWLQIRGLDPKRLCWIRSRS